MLKTEEMIKNLWALVILLITYVEYLLYTTRCELLFKLESISPRDPIVALSEVRLPYMAIR
jgi:hypothetical protein